MKFSKIYLFTNIRAQIINPLSLIETYLNAKYISGKRENKIKTVLTF